MDFKRQSFAYRRISDISPESDIAVSILGSVIGINEKTIIIDDGLGRASASFSNEDSLKNLKIGDTIRLFGYIVPNPDGFEIRGDIIQDMSKLDVEMFRKVMEK